MIRTNTIVDTSFHPFEMRWTWINRDEWQKSYPSYQSPSQGQFPPSSSQAQLYEGHRWWQNVVVQGHRLAILPWWNNENKMIFTTKWRKWCWHKVGRNLRKVDCLPAGMMTCDIQTYVDSVHSFSVFSEGHVPYYAEKRVVVRATRKQQTQQARTKSNKRT